VRVSTADAPSGVVTFLFTEVEGAKRRWEDSGIRRDVLGEPAYQSLARAGQAMSHAAMSTHAIDQIELARTELERQSS
jgi:hypothetical protein